MGGEYRFQTAGTAAAEAGHVVRLTLTRYSMLRPPIRPVRLLSSPVLRQARCRAAVLEGLRRAGSLGKQQARVS